MNSLIRYIKFATAGRFHAILNVRCVSSIKSIVHNYIICFHSTTLICYACTFQHDANAIISDPELSSQLKSAASTALKKMVGEIQEEVPVLMSGAGHDAMAMSHLTKVCSQLIY